MSNGRAKRVSASAVGLLTRLLVPGSFICYDQRDAAFFVVDEGVYGERLFARTVEHLCALRLIARTKDVEPYYTITDNGRNTVALYVRNRCVNAGHDPFVCDDPACNPPHL